MIKPLIFKIVAQTNKIYILLQGDVNTLQLQKTAPAKLQNNNDLNETLNARDLESSLSDDGFVNTWQMKSQVC